jgi:hypothetical protein
MGTVSTGVFDERSRTQGEKPLSFVASRLDENQELWQLEVHGK